jgi:IS5 family transposase
MRSSIVKELKGIADILDATPSVMDLVFQDLVKTRRPDTGREGMTA